MPEVAAPISHVRFIVGSVAILAGLAAICGTWLLWKGFAGGELLCAQVGTAIGGLLGMLSQNRNQPAATAIPAAPAAPPVVVVNQPSP